MFVWIGPCELVALLALAFADDDQPGSQVWKIAPDARSGSFDWALVVSGGFIDVARGLQGGPARGCDRMLCCWHSPCAPDGPDAPELRS